MNKLTITACPLCQSNHLRFVMKCEDYYASGEEFELFQCDDCNFLFTQNVPCGEAINRYYETPDYISHTNTNKGVVNRIYHLVRSRMLKKKASLVIRITGKTSGTILDIGTGTGYFPNMMKKKGWEVEAVEKNENARLFAKEHFALDVKDEGALKEFPAGTFDAITLWHVMEHLEQLDETWEQLHELLSEDGVLIVAVPNSKSYDAQKYKEQWAAYDVPRHLWHFTPATIQQFGSKHGFIMCEQYPMPFDAFYVSMLSEKYRKSSSPFIRGMWTGLKAWFKTESKKENSSSIIYIFRKRSNEK